MSVDEQAEWQDTQLMARVATGDQQAFKTLFERHGERVFRYAHRLINEVSKAEEVTNDVMLEVWKNAGRFEGRSRVSTWMIGIARNVALNAVRGKRIATVAIEQVPEPVDPHAGTDNIAAQQHQAGVSRLRRSALGSLSVEHRDVVELTFFHGFSYPEIAEIVGCPENTVKTRMFHAKRKLRRALGGGDLQTALADLGGLPS
ncbi:MAG: sigma-70 family RNA polymerase sigma factor [Pseudomonadales bacterium]